MAASIIESEGLTTRISDAEEQNALDLNLIKELGKRELVDSLNAVGTLYLSSYARYSRLTNFLPLD